MPLAWQVKAAVGIAWRAGLAQQATPGGRARARGWQMDGVRRGWDAAGLGGSWQVDGARPPSRASPGLTAVAGGK
ncbi:MAG: hypothetical protein J3K34DRAFT_412515 [Monoraphidium minutum]|nr:MAG: hypothetical protein J3K34DRAFT_412515 [Monoraphidium minutum]